MTDDKVGGKNGGKDGGLKEKLDLDEVELDLPLKAVTENVTENVTDNVTEKLSERQNRILDIVSRNPNTSIPTIAAEMKVSIMTIRRDIEKMSNRLRRVGPDKGGHWEIIE